MKKAFASLPTWAKAVMVALVTAIIGVSVLAGLNFVENARIRHELEQAASALERQNIEAETALFVVIGNHRKEIEKRDREIEELKYRDSLLSEQLEKNKTKGNERRTEIHSLDSAGLLRELRGVFARRDPRK